MGVFALKRYGGNDGSDRNCKHHLSLVSHVDWPVCANSDLPFDMHEIVSGSSCRGLVYFHGENGTIVVCNLTTREWKVFPLPDLELDPPPPSVESVASRIDDDSYEYIASGVDCDSVELVASGLGYDATSGDYKLIRNYVRYYDDAELEAGEVVGYDYRGYKEWIELYSFNRGSWKQIKKPDASIMRPCAVYVGESCYWTACLETTFGGLANDPVRDHIMSFDCATERFGYLSYPETCTGPHAWSEVVEYRGSLGALTYWGPNHNDVTCSSPLIIKLFVRAEMSWCMLYNLTCENVERPLRLGETNDGCILFLEGKHTSQTSQLLVYNLCSGELKELDIYDLRAHMIAISYVPNESRLPGSEPMTLVESIVPSPITSEDEEERKTTIDMVSENRPKHSVKARSDIEEV